MKNFIPTLATGAALIATAAVSYGQGQVQFQNNTTTTPITFGPNIAGGADSGQKVFSAPGAYTYGLYVAAAGTQLGSSTATLLNGFTLIDTVASPNATVSSSPFAGFIAGGTVKGLGNVGAANNFAGLVASTTYSFVIAAWTAADGASFAAATSSADGLVAFGHSAVGSVFTTATDGSTGPAPQLFTQAPATAGQVGGFVVDTNVPEPSTIALGSLGAAALLALRRRSSK